jgi:hypothetical protein
MSGCKEVLVSDGHFPLSMHSFCVRHQIIWSAGRAVKGSYGLARLINPGALLLHGRWMPRRRRVASFAMRSVHLVMYWGVVGPKTPSFLMMSGEILENSKNPAFLLRKARLLRRWAAGFAWARGGVKPKG